VYAWSNQAGKFLLSASQFSWHSRASLYLSRQDLGLAKKTIKEITTSITMSQKTIEATG